MPIETFEISSSELVREYPLLEDWFNDAQNTHAQLQGDKRLMSAEEKLALVGGESQAKSNLSSVERGWRGHYMILLACRQEAMVGREIARFGRQIGVDLAIVSLYVNIKQLMDEDSLCRIQDLVYISRRSQNRFSVTTPIPGYLTTKNGIREVARKLASRKNRGWEGKLLPVPTR